MRISSLGAVGAAGLLVLVMWGHRMADRAGEEAGAPPPAPATGIPEVPLDTRRAARDDWEAAKARIDVAADAASDREGWEGDQNRRAALYVAEQRAVASRHGLSWPQMVRVVAEPRR